MLKHPKLRISVDGHVGHGMSSTKAQDLSLQRAAMVKHKLVEMGVPEDRLSAQGFGNERPRYPNDHPEAAKNRRVEFQIVSGHGDMSELGRSRGTRGGTRGGSHRSTGGGAGGGAGALHGGHAHNSSAVSITANPHDESTGNPGARHGHHHGRHSHHGRGSGDEEGGSRRHHSSHRSSSHRDMS